MIRNRTATAVAIALTATLAIAGCKKKADETVTTTPPVTEPMPAPTTPAPAPTPAPAAVTVVSVDMGNAIGADNKVTTPTSTFAAKDTIYASVATDGAANNNTLSAKWTFQDGQVIGDEPKVLATSGPAVTEFHASKPSGWPVGKYKIEISLDGAVVQTRDFEVK